MLRKLVTSTLLLALLFLQGESHIYDKIDGHHKWKNINFISTSRPSKAQLEVRASFKGILALETLIPKIGEKGTFLRQVTNGQTLVSLIFETKDVLVDCEILHDQDHVDGFLGKFFKLGKGQDWRREDLRAMVAKRVANIANSTFEDLGKKSAAAPSDYVDLLNFELLKFECKDLQQEVKDMVKESTKQHGLKMKQDNEVGLDEKDGVKAHKKSDSKLSRAKRSMFIYPGTNWCGRGTTATDYYDLGDKIETDKCCRAHDHCTVTIEGFTNKFNYFNYRFHTLSHCECDDQFHTCLKTSGDDTSEMVGNLFFNVIGNKCFILMEEKECRKRSWWGKCVKYRKRRQAELREPLNF